MLSHRYQNRYDRVFLFDGSKLVCSKLARVAGFALVGTARLPDLTITDRHQRVLPAYPSDHFGAVATLAPAGKKPSAADQKPSAAAAAKPAVEAPAPKPAPKKSAAASFFAPRTKRTKTAAAVKYRGAAIPDGWQLVDDALLVGHFGSAPRAAQRLAGFDFDDTLSPLDWGRPDAWSHLYAHAPRVIQQLAADGHAIVVLSNEFLDRYKRLDYLEKKMRDKCSKIGAWAADVKVPVLALIALSKQDETKYHKSQGDGMWRKACADRGVSGGFYVGDSADDESLARFAGVPFHHVKEFFERMHKAS
jgi:HAD superfamily hydrolase (TIGR01662 family)